MLIVSVVLGLAAAGLMWNQTRGSNVMVFQLTGSAQPGDTLRAVIRPVGIAQSTYASMASVVPTVELQDFVANTPVVRQVQPGEFVTFDMLLQSAGERLAISPGMRAVGVDVGTAGQAVGFLLRPGDLVDVIATVPGRAQLEARHVLQARRVVAVDQQYRLEDSAFLQNRTFSSVTLEVTPTEAQQLEVYRTVVSDGFLLSLRPEGEAELVNTPGTPVPVSAVQFQ